MDMEGDHELFSDDYQYSYSHPFYIESVDSNLEREIKRTMLGLMWWCQSHRQLCNRTDSFDSLDPADPALILISD